MSGSGLLEHHTGCVLGLPVARAAVYRDGSSRTAGRFAVGTTGQVYPSERGQRLSLEHRVARIVREPTNIRRLGQRLVRCTGVQVRVREPGSRFALHMATAMLVGQP